MEQKTKRMGERERRHRKRKKAQRKIDGGNR